VTNSACRRRFRRNTGADFSGAAQPGEEQISMLRGKAKTNPTSPRAGVLKCASGIRGLDEITGGGLPRGRPTLLCGEAGTGKTLLAMEFLVRGAADYDEPGVFIAFEETARDLLQNVASLGFNAAGLIAKKKLLIDQVQIDPAEIVETGDFDLEGLFLRLGSAIDAIGAKRVAIDTIETLFGVFSNDSVLRSELNRLFKWLKQRGVTAVVTAERGSGTLTRHGLEEYVSDCVIVMEQTLFEQIATRHLRVAKYRGSGHGTNRYPFLIDERGVSVVPITSLGLQHVASRQRISTGIPQLDDMLAGGGFYRGSTAMISGTAGTGKTSVAAHFANAACARGERVLYFAFEESQSQIVRNMRSIGIDLARGVDKGLLRFSLTRPSACGLESHLADIYRNVELFRPRIVILDPITDFAYTGQSLEIKAMLARLVDFLKSRQITALFTSLVSSGDPAEQTGANISSLIDTWLLLRNIELAGERDRALHVLKSRGMAHSNQVREFLLTGKGVKLMDVYVGPDGVLTGASRVAQLRRERGAAIERAKEEDRMRRMLAHRREALEAKIASMRAEFEAEAQEIARDTAASAQRQTEDVSMRAALAAGRESVGASRRRATNKGA
jgi:circadian clock protein KaiC